MKPALAFLVGVALLAGACSGSDNFGGATPTSADTSEPDGLPAALQVVMDRISEIRGLDPVPALDAETVSRNDLPALLDSLITDEDREEAARLTTLYRLLGHFSPDQDYMTVYQAFGADSVLGLYSPRDDTLWVVSEDGKGGLDDLSGAEESTLAHEMVHALQDYHFDLDATYDKVIDNPDRNMAWTVVVEGDASYYQQKYSDEYLFAPMGGRIFSFGVIPQQTNIPPTFIREMLYPYTAGEEWVADVLKARGQQYLDGMLADPPSGTICVLHLERCLDGFEPAKVSLPDLTGGLGDGWSQEWTSTLGEFHLANFLDVELPLADGSEAADGWTGDSFATYVNGDRSLAVFRVDFSSESEAAEFSEALASYVDQAGGHSGATDSFVAETSDGRQFASGAAGSTGVVFAISSDAGPAAKALELLAGG